MAVPTYSKPSNASRAAKAALPYAVKGLDFEVYKAPNGKWAWREISRKAAPEAGPEKRQNAVAKAAPAAKPAKGENAQKAPRKAAKGKAEKTARPKKEKPLGKRAAILAEAEAGKLPDPPDFSANTHKRFRKKLGEVAALAEAGDINGLEAYQINPISSSPKAIARYRDLCVIALKAKNAKG